jgi:hypothetical protein
LAGLQCLGSFYRHTYLGHQHPSTTATTSANINHIDSLVDTSATIGKRPFGRQPWTTFPFDDISFRHLLWMTSPLYDNINIKQLGAGLFSLGSFLTLGLRSLNQKSCDLVVDERMRFLMNRICVKISPPANCNRSTLGHTIRDPSAYDPQLFRTSTLLLDSLHKAIERQSFSRIVNV